MLESTNNMEVRKINRNNIVEALLREDTLTKAGIVQTLGLSLATINTLLKELVEEGLVEQGEVLGSSGGRRPTLYQVVADARTAVGVCLTGHHIRMSYVNWKQEVLKCSKEKILFEDTEEYWLHFRDSILGFLDENGLSQDQLLGIGVSFHTEIIKDSHSLEAVIPSGLFKGVDVDKVKTLFSCRVRFFDDMKSAAYSHIGKRGGRRRYVYLQLDNRVGGAIIADDSFWGLSTRTGEFGRMLVGDGGIKECRIDENCCGCRGRGCLQYYCSSKAITMATGHSMPDFFELLKQGDEACARYWGKFRKYLLIALHNLKVIFDIDIMIGGELAPYIREHREELTEELVKYDIYGESGDFLYFSNGEEYDSAIGAGFLTVNEKD